MNAASHLLSPTVPGYGTSDGKCLPCSGIAGGSFNITPCSSRSDYKILPKFKVLHLRCGSKGSTLSICNAHSGGKKSNLDYSRRNKQRGDSRNRSSWQNEEIDDIDDEESELFPKNGQMISGSLQHQATATPGPKEKEIVEIFSNIQAILRERGAYKDVKKVEDSPGQKTVGSLIDLLKNTFPRSKQSNINGKRSGSGLDQRKEKDPALEDKPRTLVGSTKQVKYFTNKRFDQPKQNGLVVEDKSHTSLSSKDKVIDALRDSKRPSFSRPPSNFQRRSPVPRFKYKPVYSDSDQEASTDSARFTKINGKREKTLLESKSKPELDSEPELELELEQEQEPEQLAEAESYLSDESGSENEFVDLIDDEDSEMDEDAIKDDDDEENGDKDLSGMETQEVRGHVELHLMKVVELRALAKSQGLKGISRLNKQELVELLASSDGSV